MIEEIIKEKLKTIPNKPGVYLMKDNSGNIIYVGKAKSLKKRVSSYFVNKNHPLWTKIMVSMIADIEILVTKNELEALFLENNLIKAYKTHFNIRMRDDKTFPYVKITAEKYPRMLIARKIAKDKASYFGPYLSAYELRLVIGIIRKTFGIVTHTYRDGQRACLNYQIGLCAAPYAGKISQEEYLDNVKAAEKLLLGNFREVAKVIKDRMNEAAREMKYEEAEKYKRQLISLENLIEKQDVVLLGGDNSDIWGLAKLYNLVCIQLLKLREGKIIDSQSFVVENAYDMPNGEILSQTLNSYYLNLTNVPKTIYVEEEMADSEMTEIALAEKGKKVKIIVPERGKNVDLVNLAKENAENKLNAEISKNELGKKLGEALKNKLGLEKAPIKIEAYDISNLGKDATVGAMVAFVNAKPSKNEYRRFKIRNVEGQNDFAMMAEILERRFLNKDLAKPDLVIIDGGLGQLSAAKVVFEKLKLKKIALISIAKKAEIIYKPDVLTPIVLPFEDEALLYVRQIRDEVHRFAVRYHRKRRENNFPN